MKFSKIIFAIIMASGLVACGSSSTPITSYGGSSTSTIGTITGGTTTGTTCTSNGVSYSCALAGGITETQTPLFYGATTSVDANGKQFAETANVVVGDRVVVLMSQAIQTRNSFPYTYTSLSSVNVKVGGVSLGSNLQNEYSIATAGQLTASIDWLGSNSTSGTHIVSLYNGANIWVLHCTDSTNAVTACPYW